MAQRPGNRRAVAAFLVAAAGGALVWALSPLLSGHAEPWDADGPYYAVALFVAGLAAGGLIPRPVWAHYLGAVAGQRAYEIVFLAIGPLLVLGVAFLLGYSLIFVLAAALAAYVRRRYKSESPEA